MIGTEWGWWYALGFISPFLLLLFFTIFAVLFVPDSNWWDCRVCGMEAKSRIPAIRWTRRWWHSHVVARTAAHEVAAAQWRRERHIAEPTKKSNKQSTKREAE